MSAKSFYMDYDDQGIWRCYFTVTEDIIIKFEDVGLNVGENEINTNRPRPTDRYLHVLEVNPKDSRYNDWVLIMSQEGYQEVSKHQLS